MEFPGQTEVTTQGKEELSWVLRNMHLHEVWKEQSDSAASLACAWMYIVTACASKDALHARHLPS